MLFIVYLVAFYRRSDWVLGPARNLHSSKFVMAFVTDGEVLKPGLKHDVLAFIDVVPS